MIATIIAWGSRLLGGFAIWKGEKLGKVIFVVIIVILALTFYTKTFIEPKYKTISQQRIERVNKIEYHNETIVQSSKGIIRSIWGIIY